MQKYNRIYLTGFMGAGKSTLGIIIANSLGWDFMDLDREIENSIGMKIAEYFSIYGEDSFRKIEHDMLEKSTERVRTVIALGGGAVAFGDNLHFIKNAGLLVYLKSTAEQIYERLRFKMDRPIFQTTEQTPMNKEQAMDKIRVLLSGREPYYMQAHIIYESEKSNIGKSVDNLIGILLKRIVK
ncbi:MAG: shikimate kinase [Ignavibacteriales bacterium]|nr:shikimate kinase [Ignavibacteriales bacterium]